MTLYIQKIASAFHFDSKDIDYILLYKRKGLWIWEYKFDYFGGFEKLEELPLNISDYDNYKIILKDGRQIEKYDVDRLKERLMRFESAYMKRTKPI